MKSRLCLFAVLILTALPSGVAAKGPTFASATAVDPLKLLPAPPTAKSAEVRDELNEMVAMQHCRTKADVARCASEVRLHLDAFESVLGPWCTTKNLPRLAKLLAEVDADTKQVSYIAKSHFRRPRPEHEDQRIHVPIQKDSSFAYPSGHATRGMLYAMILAELVPDRRDALLERGRQIGWDRVIAGLHHPTDIYAGRMLGRAIAESLLADPKFQAELPGLKAEVRAAQHRAEASAAR